MENKVGRAVTLSAATLSTVTLSAIIDTFVDRMFNDILIGFHFRHIDRQRIKQLEYEHAAAWLGLEEQGAPLRYSGRDLKTAHAPHRITGGQFARRLHILRAVLTEFAISQPLLEAWIAHQESLRAHIVASSA